MNQEGSHRRARAHALGAAALTILATCSLLGARDSLAGKMVAPEIEKLDQYASSAKAMTQLSHQRLGEIRADIQLVGNRMASETVGKLYIPNHGEFRGCIQRGWGGQRTQLVQYSRSDLDAAINYRLEFIAQARRKLDQNLSELLAKLEHSRHQVEEAQSAAVYDARGEDNRKRRIDYIRQAASFDYWHFCRFDYQLVVSGYVVEILLRLQEMANQTGQPDRYDKAPSPLGIACQIQSELQDPEYADEQEIQALDDAATMAESNEERDRLHAQAEQKAQQCYAREERDVTTMAAKLRELRDRFLLERAQVREQMIHWQQECIKQHFYEGEGQPSISQVYGGWNSTLSVQNLADLRFPLDEVTAFLQSSNFTLGNMLGDIGLSDLHYRLPALAPHTGCAERVMNTNNFTTWRASINSGLADLMNKVDCETDTGAQWCLGISESAPVIQENVASGAGALERP